MNAAQSQVAQPWEHTAEANGVRIERGTGGFRVVAAQETYEPLTVQVTVRGQTFAKILVNPLDGLEQPLTGLDPRECVIRVLDAGGECLVSLGAARKAPCENYQPFMELQSEQVHITENYVSVPPALTITDAAGAVWTLGFGAAPEWQSPRGEFAFAVLRDGLDAGEVASRIERRNGKVRVFTRRGWKIWNGSAFI